MSPTSSRSNRSRSVREPTNGVYYCNCRERAPLETSWTRDNPGRRFFGCPNWRVRRCTFFKWFDDKFTKRSVEVINGFLDDLESPDKDVNWKLIKAKDKIQVLKMEVEMLDLEMQRLKAAECPGCKLGRRRLKICLTAIVLLLMVYWLC